MVFERDLRLVLARSAGHFPVVVVTGPRQSGKTTLCRAAFPGHAYVSLEAPDVRARARDDPRGFLAAHRDGAILDEAQHAPDLFSYIQEDVDARPDPGRFVLTGSQHFGLSQSISQSLAGRAAVHELLPLSFGEMRRAGKAPARLFDAVFFGGYPAIHARGIPPVEWLAAYVGTYVERDVRLLLNVTDLVAFQTFLGLAAGRTAQLLQLASLGSDAGITHNTAKAWVSVLEASYVAFRLPPFHRNVRRRLVKAPKLHFYDSGLVCYLLGIRSPDELRTHPLRGAIFESWVVSEIAKSRRNDGAPPDLTFFRDAHGLEVDLVVGAGGKTIAVEAKSGETVPVDAFAALDAFATLVGRDRSASVLVHGGGQRFERRGAVALPWNEIDGYDWRGARSAEG